MFSEVRNRSSRMMYRGRWGAPGSLEGGGGRMGLKNGAAEDDFHANLRAQDRCFQARNSSNPGIAGGPCAGVRPRAPPGPPWMVRRGGGGRGVFARQGEAHTGFKTYLLIYNVEKNEKFASIVP